MQLVPTIKTEPRFYAQNSVTKKFWDGEGFNACAFGNNKKSLTDVEALVIKHTYMNVDLTRFDIELPI